MIHGSIDVSLLYPEHGEERKKEFTLRPMRIGTMTENHIHPDLNMADEYTLSDHTHHRNNVNMDAKGYIEKNPALNECTWWACRCWSQQLSLCACYIQ